MPALNPITHTNPAVLAAALALDPAFKAEARLEQLLYLWLSAYFTGTAFNTRAAGAGTEAKTFTKCVFDFQEGHLPDNPQNPQIHLVFADRKTRRLDYTSTKRGDDDDWMIHAMVKVPPVLSGTEMDGGDADAIARQVAGELDWLLRSTEREALAEAGITRVKLERPAVILPASAWKMRQSVFSCRTRAEQPKKSF